MEHIVYITRPAVEGIEVKWETQKRQELTDYYNSLSDRIEVTLTDAELKKLGYTYDNKLMLTDLSASRKFALGKTASDVDPVNIDELNAEQLDFFGIGKDPDGRYFIKEPSAELIEKNGTKAGEKMYISEMKPKALKYFNSHNIDKPTGIVYFNISKSHTVMLNTITDAQLADFGISESGDVMTLVIPPPTVESEDEENTEEPAEETTAAEPVTKIVFRYYVAELEDYYDVDSRHLSLDLLNS